MRRNHYNDIHTYRENRPSAQFCMIDYSRYLFLHFIFRVLSLAPRDILPGPSEPTVVTHEVPLPEAAHSLPCAVRTDIFIARRVSVTSFPLCTRTFAFSTAEATSVFI